MHLGLTAVTCARCVVVQELAQVRTRTALEIKAKEAEVAELQQQLSTHAEAKYVPTGMQSVKVSVQRGCPPRMLCK